MPLAIIAGLLYAGLFVKPVVRDKALLPPILERRDQFHGIAVVAGGTVIAAGSDGKIVLGNPDDGKTVWRLGASSISRNLQAVDAWDSQRLIAVGNEGAAIASQDGGSSWSRLDVPRSAPSNKLIRVRTGGAGVAFAAGEYNTLLRTLDFGKTWVRLLPEKDSNWYGLDLSGDAILIVGEFGRIAHSRDSGATWNAGRTSAKVHLTGVAWGPEDSAVAVGLNGTVLASQDGGKTWNGVDTGLGEHIYDVIWANDRYVACGTRGLLIESVDGRHWSTIANDLGSLANFTWFSQVRSYGKGYLVAGSRLGYLENGHLHDFAAADNSAEPKLTDLHAGSGS